MRTFITPLLLAGALALPAVPALAQPLGVSVTIGPRGFVGATVGVPAYPVYPAPYTGGVPAYPAAPYGGYPATAYGGPYYPAPVYVAPAYLPPPPRVYYRPAPVVVVPAPGYYGYRHPHHGHRGHHGWR